MLCLYQVNFSFSVLPMLYRGFKPQIAGEIAYSKIYIFNPNSLDNKGSCWILKDCYCSVTMLRELGLMVKLAPTLHCILHVQQRKLVFFQ